MGVKWESGPRGGTEDSGGVVFDLDDAMAMESMRR